ncbi:MAG: response regulator transcription factor [Gammaproteobacteria bacterium]|nr:response regulator transcription factor [Gammaproteobacteria bacterium]
MSTAGKKVLLVDDHPVVRKGLRFLLEAKHNYQISEADSAEEAYQLYKQLCPDVVILDISMPGMGGIEGLRRLKKRYPDACVLLLSMYDDLSFVTRALEMGAQGYVSKNSAETSLAMAIETALRGKTYISEEISAQLDLNQRKLSNHGRLLSTREFEIFRLLAEGRSPMEIADDLNLSPKTVSNHRSKLMEKLNLHSTAELVRYAIRQGIVKP